MTKTRTPILVLVALAILSTACTQIAVPTDAVLCIYGAGGNDGLDLKEQLLPGSDPYTDREGRNVATIETSNRFLLIDDSANADPGMPPFVSGTDAQFVPLEVEAKLRFVFNAQTACEWFNQHGLRNAVDYDMGFNAPRGEMSPWLRWLGENFLVELERIVPRATRQFGWEHLVYDLPVGADTLGNMPEDATDTDMVPARQSLEAQLTEMFSAELNARIGTDDGLPFFCGIGHNQAAPEDCSNIQVEVIDIATSDETLMDARQEAAARQNQLQSARRQEELAAEQAEIDATARARREAEAIAEAESQARIAAEQLRAELGITDDTLDIIELEVRKAEAEARESVQPCLVAGASGVDCVLLLAVLRGQDLPQILGDIESSAQFQVPVDQ